MTQPSQNPIFPPPPPHDKNKIPAQSVRFSTSAKNSLPGYKPGAVLDLLLSLPILILGGLMAEDCNFFSIPLGHALVVSYLDYCHNLLIHLFTCESVH